MSDVSTSSLPDLLSLRGVSGCGGRGDDSRWKTKGPRIDKVLRTGGRYFVFELVVFDL